MNNVDAKCLKCGAFYPHNSNKPTAYCPECVAWFRESQRAAYAKQNVRTGSIFAHADGKLTDDACPVSLLCGPSNVCGLCGENNLEMIYGHCCYGLGTFYQCGDCRAILDFQEDTGD